MKKFGQLKLFYEKTKNFFKEENLISILKKSTAPLINSLNNFLEEIKIKISDAIFKKLSFDFSSTFDTGIDDGWNCSKNLITVRWDRNLLQWKFFENKEEKTYLDYCIKCLKSKHICNGFVGKYYNYKFSDIKLKLAIEKLRSFVDKKIDSKEFQNILAIFKNMNSVSGRKLGAAALGIGALTAAAGLGSLIGGLAGTSSGKIRKGDSDIGEASQTFFVDKSSNKVSEIVQEKVNKSLLEGIKHTNRLFLKEEENKMEEEKIQKEEAFLPNKTKQPQHPIEENDKIEQKTPNLTPIEQCILVMANLFYHQVFRICDELNLYMEKNSLSFENVEDENLKEEIEDFKRGIISLEQEDLGTKYINYKNYYFNNYNADRLNFFISIGTPISLNIFNAAVELAENTTFSNNPNNNIFSLKDNNIFSTFKRLMPSLKKIIPIPSEKPDRNISDIFKKWDKKYMFLGNHENFAFWILVLLNFNKINENILELTDRYIAFVESIAKARDNFKILNSYLSINVSILLTCFLNAKIIALLFDNQDTTKILNYFKSNKESSKHIFITEDELIPEIQWAKIEEKNYVNLEILKRFYGFITDPCILNIEKWGLVINNEKNLDLVRGDDQIDVIPWLIDGFEKNNTYLYYDDNKNEKDIGKNPFLPIGDVEPKNCVEICGMDKSSKIDDKFPITENINSNRYKAYFLEFNFSDWIRCVQIIQSYKVDLNYSSEELEENSFIETYILNYERTGGWILKNFSKNISSFLLLKDLTFLFKKRLVAYHNIGELFANLSLLFVVLNKDLIEEYLKSYLAPYLSKEFQIYYTPENPIMQTLKVNPFITKQKILDLHKIDDIIIFDSTNGEEDITYFMFESIGFN